MLAKNDYTCYFQILLSEVDFWEKTREDMQLEHDERIYPPKVSVIAYTNHREVRIAAVTTEIRGTRNDKVPRINVTGEACMCMYAFDNPTGHMPCMHL